MSTAVVLQIYKFSVNTYHMFQHETLWFALDQYLCEKKNALYSISTYWALLFMCYVDNHMLSLFNGNVFLKFTQNTPCESNSNINCSRNKNIELWRKICFDMSAKKQVSIDFHNTKYISELYDKCSSTIKF